jgi:DNA-binding beta-propeller fold protein YncE
MLVSDNTTGAVNVVDAKTDLITRTVAVLSPGKMVSAGGTTLIQSTIASSVAIFDNASEAIRFTVPLSGLPLDVAITPDGKTGWVAVNDGTVQSINTATGAISGNFAVAGVQRLIIGPQGTTVVAFNDTLAINFTIILSAGAAQLGNLGLDHPANGFFFSDDNHFQVFDCGGECGGTQAGVAGVALGLAGGPFIGPPIALSGATVGLLSGNTIFAAGSPTSGLNAGTLQTINTSTNAVSPVVHVADGRHGLMLLTSNGRIYLGSTGCTLGAVNPQNLRQGCLSIFDTTTQAVTPVLLPAGRPNGDVTGLAPVTGRNVIYVVQGGVLDIFDITTNAVSTTATAPSIPGTALGVVQLSP